MLRRAAKDSDVLAVLLLFGSALCDAAFAAIRAFERFKRTYRAYLEEVEHGRP